jgi:hypothetical protein
MAVHTFHDAACRASPCSLATQRSARFSRGEGAAPTGRRVACRSPGNASLNRDRRSATDSGPRLQSWAGCPTTAGASFGTAGRDRGGTGPWRSPRGVRGPVGRAPAPACGPWGRTGCAGRWRRRPEARSGYCGGRCNRTGGRNLAEGGTAGRGLATDSGCPGWVRIRSLQRVRRGRPRGPDPFNRESTPPPSE